MVGKRIRAICRHVAVAKRRRKQPKWVATLLNEAVVHPAAGAQPAVVAESSQEPETRTVENNPGEDFLF
eukprot:2112939-Lingulodinium_polyedra.AAC.1